MPSARHHPPPVLEALHPDSAKRLTEAASDFLASGFRNLPDYSTLSTTLFARNGERITSGAPWITRMARADPPGSGLALPTVRCIELVAPRFTGKAEQVWQLVKPVAASSLALAARIQLDTRHLDFLEKLCAATFEVLPRRTPGMLIGLTRRQLFEKLPDIEETSVVNILTNLNKGDVADLVSSYKHPEFKDRPTALYVPTLRGYLFLQVACDRQPDAESLRMLRELPQQLRLEAQVIPKRLELEVGTLDDHYFIRGTFKDLGKGSRVS